MIEFLLDRSAFGDGEEICGHIRSLKVRVTSLIGPGGSHGNRSLPQDIKKLSLTPNSTSKSDVLDSSVDRALFVCPLNFKEMTGVVPFVYLSTCGCVFSQAGLKAVSSSTPPSEKGKEKDAGVEGARELDVCPQCATKYDRAEDVRVLNPGPEEEERMRTAMERRRAAAAGAKGKGKKRKAAGVIPEGAEGEQPAGKKSGPRSGSAAPSMGLGATSRAVASSLAMEEVKRKANMSEAVKSLYRPKDGKARKETFMTMNTFTRVSRVECTIRFADGWHCSTREGESGDVLIEKTCLNSFSENLTELLSVAELRRPSPNLVRDLTLASARHARPAFYTPSPQ